MLLSVHLIMLVGGAKASCDMVGVYQDGDIQSQLSYGAVCCIFIANLLQLVTDMCTSHLPQSSRKAWIKVYFVHQYYYCFCCVQLSLYWFTKFLRYLKKTYLTLQPLGQQTIWFTGFLLLLFPVTTCVHNLQQNKFWKNLQRSSSGSIFNDLPIAWSFKILIFRYYSFTRLSSYSCTQEILLLDNLTLIVNRIGY